jgi:hypothetical protein
MIFSRESHRACVPPSPVFRLASAVRPIARKGPWSRCGIQFVSWARLGSAHQPAVPTRASFRDRTGRPTSASNLRHVERVRKNAPTACTITAIQQAASTILALTPGLMLVTPSCGSTPERTKDCTSSYENSDDQVRKGVEQAPRKTLAVPGNRIASPLKGSTHRTRRMIMLSICFRCPTCKPIDTPTAA